jgi:hypothetical protein
MEDPTILTGIAKIVNKRKVNNKLNLDAIERDLIGGGGLTQHPIKDVDAELNDLLKDIRTPAFDKVIINRDPVQSFNRDSSKSLGNPMSSVNEISISRLPPTAAGNKIQQFIENTDQNESDEELMDSDDDAVSDSVSEVASTQPPASAYYPPLPPVLPYNVPKPMMQKPVYSTAPQVQQNYAQEALQVYANDYNTEESIIEQEKLEDLKEKMLADIDELREELQSDGINTSRIPEVNMDSLYDTVNKVYKQLKRKYDRSRCEDLGQGVVLAATRMLEMACDGEKSYFGIRPDMTGFHRTVRSKMRRMKYEQSQIVSNALEYYNVGPVTRMGLELIPSAFLYSLSRREQHGKDNYTPDRETTGRGVDRSAALDDLRQFEY